MEKISKLFIFVILIIVLFIFSLLINGKFVPDATVENIWFYSGIMMVLISQFFIEPYYSAPSNVAVNTLAIILVMLSIKDSFQENLFAARISSIILIYSTILFVLSFMSMSLTINIQSENSVQNKISRIFKELSVAFGKGKFIFSIVFVAFLLLYHSIQDINILLLLLFWSIIVLLDPQKLSIRLNKTLRKKNSEIGEVIGVQSKKMFLAKLYSDRPKNESIRKFDIVSFKYSMREEDVIYNGIVFDKYLLNEQKWIKILYINSSLNAKLLKKENIIHKLNYDDSGQIKDFVNRFVGIVIDNSDVERIIFEYSSVKVELQDGDLVEASIRGKRVYYQISNGITKIEILEKKNESGLIRGEAIQLGVWNEQNLCFEKYGWVPEVNTPILIAVDQVITIDETYPNYKLGVIPGTNFPSILNLDIAISHHIAILGVTGAGKSFIAREIIKELQSNIKVICVDFTGEWAERLSNLGPVFIIKNKEGLADVEHKIASLQEAKRRSAQETILNYKKEIQEKLKEYIMDFVKNEKNLAIFELPDLSNTSFILEFTQLFLDAVFNIAKSEEETKVCIVIEEAHTVVPETTSLGDLGDYGSNKALVNKIGQIALQGRKYGVGFMVIAQRTANVSKTVLTQCNSIIAFKAFDKTSYDFLSNYFGESYSKVLPHLKTYNAIVAGKAFKSQLPMIVDLTRT